MTKPKRTADERIADVDARIAALQQERRRIKASAAKQARKDRTKRLIETTAFLESEVGAEISALGQDRRLDVTDELRLLARAARAIHEGGERAALVRDALDGRVRRVTRQSVDSVRQAPIDWDGLK